MSLKHSRSRRNSSATACQKTSLTHEAVTADDYQLYVNNRARLDTECVRKEGQQDEQPS
jgi:hypothetical protein